MYTLYHPYGSVQIIQRILKFLDVFWFAVLYLWLLLRDPYKFACSVIVSLMQLQKKKNQIVISLTHYNSDIPSWISIQLIIHSLKVLEVRYFYQYRFPLHNFQFFFFCTYLLLFILIQVTKHISNIKKKTSQHM